MSKCSSRRFHAVGVLLLTAALAGCGGGGGGGSQPAGAAVIPVLATPAAQNAASGPVQYLSSSGPLSSSGLIPAGAHQAFVAVMSSATASGNSFQTDSLVVQSGAVPQSVAVRSQSVQRSAAPPAHLGGVEAFPADDRALLGRLASNRTGLSAAPQVRTQSVMPSTLQPGASASLWVQQSSLSGAGRTNVQVPSTLLVQSAHGNIWVDNSLLGGTSASASFSASARASTAAQIASDFENAYASDTAHFASPHYGTNAPGLQPQYKSCSSSGASQGTTRGYVSEPADGRINVLVVNPQNLGGTGGYFSGANMMYQSALNCLNGGGTTYESNEAPFIFVGWFDRNGATYELQEDLVRSTAHELQHLINFVNHALLAPGASSGSFDGNETPFINEGLSMLAQDLAVENMYGSRGLHFDVDDALARANAFLANPANFSISQFSGIDSASWGGGSAQYNCAGGCYGGAYLFQRYLRDRFGGDAYTHAMETSGVTGTQNLQSVTQQAPGTLLDDFALAMAAGTAGVTPSDPRFAFGSLGLTGTYADQFGGSTTLAGAYAAPLSASSATVRAPVGGFAFVAVPAVPAGGMPVQVTDQASISGFGMAAGLVQH